MKMVLYANVNKLYANLTEHLEFCHKKSGKTK